MSSKKAKKPKESSDSPDERLSIEEFPEAWMVKPCWTYDAEYKDCSCWKERFNQYFIYGENQDCSQWKTDHQNCVQWETKKDKEALQKVIDSEVKRVSTRLRNHFQNNIWENREKPPQNWNTPLPPEITRDYETSYLHLMREQQRDKELGIEETAIQAFTRRALTCVIM